MKLNKCGWLEKLLDLHDWEILNKWYDKSIVTEEFAKENSKLENDFKKKYPNLYHSLYKEDGYFGYTYLVTKVCLRCGKIIDEIDSLRNKVRLEISKYKERQKLATQIYKQGKTHSGDMYIVNPKAIRKFKRKNENL